jgi:replication-associated recombination protein RarA
MEKITDMKMRNRPLSVSLRPAKLKDYMSSQSFKQNLESQMKSRMPHFFLITGQTGSGKTTLARIIANEYISNPLVIEINASDKNGVDDMRTIIAESSFRPVGYSSKVYIFDEAHQMTTQAQNALLKITEESPEHVYFIFCTNNDAKILATLKRRAYTVGIKPLNETEIREFIEGVQSLVSQEWLVDKKGEQLSMGPFVQALVEHSVDSPGLILQALEKYIGGESIENSIYGNVSEGSLEIKKICSMMVKGEWVKLCPFLELLKKEDIPIVRNCLLGYYKTVLLSGSSGSTRIANAIKIVSEECYDLPTFLANLCLACCLPRT